MQRTICKHGRHSSSCAKRHLSKNKLFSFVRNLSDKGEGCAYVLERHYQKSGARHDNNSLYKTDTSVMGTLEAEQFDFFGAENISKANGDHEFATEEHALSNQYDDFEPVDDGCVLTFKSNRWKDFTLAKIIHVLSELPDPPLIDDLICIFQIFRKCKNLKYGKLLHAYVCKFGLEAQKIVGNHLVQLFAEYGCLSMALQVLLLLKDHNLYTWTSLMLGCVQCGQAHNAISLYRKMHEVGLYPSKHTLVVLLKACNRLKDLEMGQQINTCLVQRGLEMDLFVGSTLIDIYAKCGLLVDTEKVFGMLAFQNTISWSALIAAYVEHEHAEDAFDCFERMQSEGIYPDEVTFVSVLKSCGMLQMKERSFIVHCDIVMKGFESRRVVGNSLVDMYAKCRLLAEGSNVFHKLAVRDVVSWTALITGYSEHGTNEELLLRFEEMQLEGVLPDAATFASVLKACTTLGDIERGRKIHKLAEESKVEAELFVCSALVDMYAKHGFLLEAQEAFDKLPCRDLVSWNALLAGYAEHGPCKKVIGSFRRMQSEGVSQGPVTYLCALKACGNMGAEDMGQELHLECALKAFDTDLAVGSTLVDMYGKLGLLSEAQCIFHNLHAQDVVSWNAIIKAHGINQEGHVAVELFECMQGEGLKPDNATLTCLLTACSRSSLVQKGQQFFSVMTKEHGVLATREHVACMVDLLGRSGQVEEAWKVLESLPCLPSDQGLRALLSACKTHTEQALGIVCYEQLIRSNPVCAAPYLLLSDIYGRQGKWEFVHRLEELRRITQAKKTPASAMIEVRQKVHEFLVGDTENMAYSHYLGTLHLRVVNYGHVPDVDVVF